MSKVKVPEFENMRSFCQWVDKLRDKEIQSWKTKDWLDMYEKLDKLPQAATTVEETYLKEALIKLYRNYRLEEADFRSMREIGKKIGHNLAEQNLMVDLAGINIRNQFTEGSREVFAEAADKAVYDATSYPASQGTQLNKYEVAGSKIEVFDAVKEPGLQGAARKYNDYSSSIRISDETITDVYGSVPFHESVHAQMQTLKEGQKEALEKLGIKPQESFSEDFYKLLQYNDKYYVHDTNDTILYSDLERKLESGEITAKEFENFNSRQVFRGYAKQPLETQAEIIGVSAEHYYRQKTGQLSERAARAFTDVFGTPQFAQYNSNGGIDLAFQVKNKGSVDNLIKTFIDDETILKLKFNYDEAKRLYTISVPQDFTTKQTLDQASLASKFSTNLGLLPTSVDYGDTEKIVMHYNQSNAEDLRNIFENNRFGTISDEALANIEIKPMEGGGCTIAIPKNAEKYNKIVSEMAELNYRFATYKEQVQKAVQSAEAGKTVKIACDYIPKDEDLSFLNRAELEVKELGKNVKLPKEVVMAKVPDGLDLSSAERVIISEYKANIGKNVKFPKEVVMNVVPDGADLSSAEKLVLEGELAIEVGDNVKLPKEVTVKYAHYGLNLSGVEKVVFDGTAPRLDCQLPKNVEVRNAFMVELPDQEIKFSGKCSVYGRNADNPIDLSKCDFSEAQKVELGNCKITAETKLPAGEKVVLTDIVEVADREALEKVLKADVSKASVIQVPSQDMMKGLEYPKNTMISFADTESVYVPNEEALNRYVERSGEKLPAEVKIIRPKDVAKKTAEKESIGMASKQAVKKSLGAQAKNTALKVNKLYDDTFDKAVEKMMKMDAPQWAKSVDNAMAKPVHMAAEQMQKWGEKFVKTPTGAAIQKQVEKSIAKVGGKTALKSAAKKIPLVCVGIACAMAKERFERGDYIAGTAEVISGVAACVPIYGTAVSLAIDGAVLLSDLGSYEPQSVDYEFKSRKAYMPDATKVSISQVEVQRRCDDLRRRQEELKQIKATEKVTEVVYEFEQPTKGMNNNPLSVSESTHVEKPVVAIPRTRTRDMTDDEAKQVLNERKRREVLRRHLDKYIR